ncbi:MAG: hypothetical protein ACO32I_03525 [Candidatus Limnocylindrus sp.]
MHKIPTALYGYAVTAVAAAALGYSLGVRGEDARLRAQVDEAAERLAACVERRVASNVEAVVERTASCISDERAACDRRVEQLRTSFIQMKCELCK